MAKKQFMFTNAERKTRFATGKRLEKENLARQSQNLKEQEAVKVEERALKRKPKPTTNAGKKTRKDEELAIRKKLHDLVKKFSRIQFEMSQQVVVPFLGKLNRQDWGVWYPKCLVVKQGENAAEKCADICKPSTGNRDFDQGMKCDSINIVPWKNPATSAFAGEVNTMIPDWCMDDFKSMDIPDNARICYQLLEAPPNDGGPAMTVTNDPEDPVWYSTCLKVKASQNRVFAAPNCGKPCQLDDSSLKKGAEWRFGDSCISCAMMAKNNEETSAKFVPEWSLAPANACENCEAPPPTPSPSPPLSPPSPSPAPPAAGWKKVPSKQCAGFKSSETAYKSLSAAETACSAASTCYGVYDQLCNNKGDFYLCQQSSKWKASSASCIYAKPSSGLLLDLDVDAWVE